jgi:hypothetical protein
MGTPLKLWIAAASLALSACATPQIMDITYPHETGEGFNSLDRLELVKPGLPTVSDRAAG